MTDHELDGIEQYREREHYSLDPRDQPFEDESWRDEPAEERDEDVLLDAFDIAALNGVRDILEELGDRLKKLSFEGEAEYMRGMRYRDAGHLAGRAEDAEAALFQILNYGKHHLGIAVSDAQMHNRKEEGA